MSLAKTQNPEITEKVAQLRRRRVLRLTIPGLPRPKSHENRENGENPATRKYKPRTRAHLKRAMPGINRIERIREVFYKYGTREQRNEIVLEDNFHEDLSPHEYYERRFQMEYESGLLPSLEDIADGKHDPMRLLRFYTIVGRYMHEELFGIQGSYPERCYAHAYDIVDV